MPRFAKMLAIGMQNRGHLVESWSPNPLFYNIPAPGFLKKWLGYLDQYVVFPLQIRKRLKNIDKNALFVLTDHALGPWLPSVANRPNVVHCHDFLAQQSALGMIPENPTSRTGKLYQQYIRKGYSKGKNFISVSEKTRQELHTFLNSVNLNSDVVYNGLNQSFKMIDPVLARTNISRKTGLDLSGGYLLHVGGNQWYKNRVGVVDIYDAWQNQQQSNVPLLLIGSLPDEILSNRINLSPYKSNIYNFGNIEDELINDVYSGASVFLFPSLAEGFGWPIAEAMACGCPVITTDEAPMTEVAGKAAFLIPKKPSSKQETKDWATKASKVLAEIFSFSVEKRKMVVDAGIENAKRFDVVNALNQIETIYKNILKKENLI